MLSEDEIYDLQLKYLNSIIDCYRSLNCLTVFQNSNYYITEYFSVKFTNLGSLCLGQVVMPKENLRNIINNLPCLHSLILLNVTLSYSEKDIGKNFQFSRNLHKLKIENCNQFECDIKDPVELNQHIKSLRFSNFSIADISVDSIKSLKLLYWGYIAQNGAYFLNKTLLSNLELKKLEVPFQALNIDSFVIISKNKNLIHLTINQMISMNIPTQFLSVNLPYIKSLEIHNTPLFMIENFNQLILNCSNLQKLTYTVSPGSERSLLNITKYAPNLKTLIILIDRSFSYILLTSPFSESNLEHLEFQTRGRLVINLSLYKNLRSLKSVKIKAPPICFSGFSNITNFYDLRYWKIHKYIDSIQYWKI